MELFVYLNGDKRGPFSDEQLRRMLAEGSLRAGDLAAAQPNAEFKPLSSFDLAPPLSAHLPEPGAPPSPPPLPAAGGSLGSYARATIAPNENVIYKTSAHWILFVRYAVAALLVLFFVALPLAIGLQAFLGWRIGWILLPFTLLILVPPTLIFLTSELVVTNRRVLIKTGAISRQTLEMFISKIESVGVDQSFLGRLLDFGTVIIRGTGGSEEPFTTIAHPLRFRNAVQRVQSDGAMQPR